MLLILMNTKHQAIRIRRGSALSECNGCSTTEYSPLKRGVDCSRRHFDAQVDRGSGSAGGGPLFKKIPLQSVRFVAERSRNNQPLAADWLLGFNLESSPWPVTTVQWMRRCCVVKGTTAETSKGLPPVCFVPFLINPHNRPFNNRKTICAMIWRF